MKTYKNLYPQITDFTNLLDAARKAQRGKRFQDPVGKFNTNLEKELFALQEELTSHRYKPGEYHAFYIEEPKPRMISAAPYRDRVVHHALCNIVTPILERSMIHDTYANRSGKGTHKAILRYQSYSKSYPYALKGDIRKFFPSIDHALLKQVLRRKIGCRATLRLIDKIIDGSNEQEPVPGLFPGDDLFTSQGRRKGLPIGNLTSQWFGNYFLSGLDHFVKEELRCKAYVRYVDDFVLLHEDKAQLAEWRIRIRRYLLTQRLWLHERKSIVFRSQDGCPFLGHRIFPHYRWLRQENLRRARKRLRRSADALNQGKIENESFQSSLLSWCAHASFSRTYRLQSGIFSELQQQGIDLEKTMGVARRLLEQQQ